MDRGCRALRMRCPGRTPHPWGFCASGCVRQHGLEPLHSLAIWSQSPGSSIELTFQAALHDGCAMLLAWEGCRITPPSGEDRKAAQGLNPVAPLRSRFNAGSLLHVCCACVTGTRQLHARHVQTLLRLCWAAYSQVLDICHCRHAQQAAR